MPLAEAQAALRDAIVAGRAGAALPLLTGGRDPTYRLSIHQRHYDQSIVDLLRKRFPVLDWLVGEPFMTVAAIDFARAHPPRRPALGAYGEAFPAFLAARPGAEPMPWLAEVGALEWTLAEVAAAIEAPPAAITALAAFAEACLDALHLRLQPGTAYRMFNWPVDDLVKLHLDGNAPERLDFVPNRVFLEMRGARGAFSMRRLDEATFALRKTLADGAPLATALTAAPGEAAFDPGAALASLFADGIVTDVFAADLEPDVTSADIAGAMRTWRPRVWFVRARWWLNQVPTSLFLLALRIGVALVFFTSGRIKLITWDFTIRLFTEEFKLPVIPPDVAAAFAAFVELAVPPFLIIGLAARLATLPLLGMLAVIQILVYPNSWPDTLLWGGALLLILSRGPGAISVDHLIERTIVTGSIRLGIVVLGLLVTAGAAATWYFAYNDAAHAALSCLFVTGAECSGFTGLSPIAAVLPYSPVFIWVGIAILALGGVLVAASDERRTVWS